MKTNLKNCFRYSISLIVIFFLIRYLWLNWSQLKTYEFTLNLWYILLSAILSFAFFIFSVYCWKKILIILGNKTSFRQSMKIKLLADLGRYVPGKVWIVFGRLSLGKRYGISRKQSFTGFVIETGINVIAAAIVSVLMLYSLQKSLFYYFLFLIPALLMLLHPRLFERLTNFGLNLLNKGRIKVKFRFRHLLLLLVYYILLWLVIGLAFLFLIKSIVPVTFSSYFGITAIFAASWVIGFLSIITPGGLGVREASLSFFLSFYINPALAIVIALVSRVLLTLVELTLVLFAAVSR